MDNQSFITKDIPTDTFLKIIGKYYSDIYHKNILINYNIRIDDNDKLDLKIYFEKYNSRGINIITLNYNDIFIPLKKYADSSGYELNSFKYCGGIRHVGYFTDEDTPYFAGIRLFMKEKNKLKKKIKD